jgi:conjugal transfer pilus assembly protein TraF
MRIDKNTLCFWHGCSRAVSTLLLLIPLAAHGEFYRTHAEGWHWYKEHEEKTEENTGSIVNNSVKQMNAIKAAIELALNTAILHPTEANVKNYIELQNRISNQASLFADMWSKVLYNNPQLNYSLVHPTNNVAKQVDLDIQKQQEDDAIANLAAESGLFFFYSGSCVYCRKFAPILKDFATTYKIEVIPISMDDSILPEFPNVKQDQGQSRLFNVTAEPSLFAVNPYTGKAYPVSHGLVSQDFLRKRILDIARDFRSDI